MRQSFIFAVSHELKTPLAIIQGYAEGLDSLHIDEATRQKYCHVIQSETVKMDNLVKSLLNLSRLETGSFKLEKTAFDFAALTDEAKERFANAIHKKGIHMEWHVPDEMTVYGDPEQIDIVLSNFLSNAIDYTPDGGRIAVSCKVQETNYVVSVYNQGIQIPEEYQPVFGEPFYKVDIGAKPQRPAEPSAVTAWDWASSPPWSSFTDSSTACATKRTGVTFWFTIQKG